MTELRPFLAAAARRTLGAAPGLGLAWSMVFRGSPAVGPAAPDAAAAPFTLAVHMGPLATRGLDLALQP